jgi:hypothetical protein
MVFERLQDEPKLVPFVPAYAGVVQSAGKVPASLTLPRASFERGWRREQERHLTALVLLHQDYIKLENLIFHFDNPAIMDIKMGTRCVWQLVGSNRGRVCVCVGEGRGGGWRGILPRKAHIWLPCWSSQDVFGGGCQRNQAAQGPLGKDDRFGP